MDHSIEATYYRTALLLGLIKGDAVHQWAEQVIEHVPEPHPAFFEVVSAAPTDLTALRIALWPLVVEPEPLIVLQAILGLVHADLEFGRRGLPDTITVLRQMRSMLRLPRPLYQDLNDMLVRHAAAGAEAGIVATWLRQFEQSSVAELRTETKGS